MDEYTRPHPDNAALLTIDVQNDFTLPGSAAEIDGTAAAVPRMRRLVETFREDGQPIVDWEPPADPVFVLSDHRDFTAEELDVLGDAAADRIRLGPRPIHADHAITVAHNYLDTDGYGRY